MKNKYLALPMALALAGAATSAHAISGFTLDSNGAAPGGTLYDITDPGFFDGNMLAQNSVSGVGGVGGSAAANVFAHAFHAIPNSGGSELTLNLTFPTASAITGSSLGFADLGAGRLDIFFDPSGNARLLNGATSTGTEYTDGVRILSGTVSYAVDFNNNPIDFSFTNTCAGGGGADCQVGVAGNAPFNVLDTIRGTGSMTIDVVWDTQDMDYVSPVLIGSGLKAVFSNALALPFPSTTLASTHFNGVAADGTVTAAGAVDYGDGDNDYICANAFDTCDLQWYMSSTTDFADIPEPGTLALLGAGLGLMGMRRRAKKG